MSRLAGLAGVALVVVAAMVFAALNGGHRVTVDLVLVTLYRVPLTFVAFGGLVTGMVVMLLAGLHSDLRVRTILRERLAEEDREEKSRVDTHQQELFAVDGNGDSPTASPWPRQGEASTRMPDGGSAGAPGPAPAPTDDR